MALPMIPWSKTPLSSNRKSLESAHSVQQTALDLYTLGYSDLAKKLLDTLYDAYQGFEFNVSRWETGQSLYYVWDADSDSKPAFLTNSNSEFIISGRDTHREGIKKRWDRVQKWEEGLPEELKDKYEKSGLTMDDSKWALKRITGDSDSGLSIGAAIQVAVQADDKTTAEEIILECVWKVYAHLRDQWLNIEANGAKSRKQVQKRLGLHYSPGFWNILQGKSHIKALNIDEEALNEFVNEGCDLIKKRFTEGPARPYANMSTAELLRIMDKSYIAARKANPEAGEHMSVLSVEDWPNQLTTFLKPGATATQISACEQRLSEAAAPDMSDDTSQVMLPDGALPEDYKDFLETSDGFQVETGDSTGILCSVSEVGDADVLHLYDMEFTLFPFEYTSVFDINNILLGEFSCFSIGAGGDEGVVVLIPPSSVKPVLEEFEKVYETASEADKRVYARAALDLYGGLEKMRKMEWICMSWYHWDAQQHVWGSFREFLEECVGYAVERRRKDEEEARKEEEKKKEKSGETGGLKRPPSPPVPNADADVDAGEDGNERYDLRDRKSRQTS